MEEELQIYLRVREKEGRLYSDQVVRQLPDVSAGHPLSPEWKARAASSRRLVRYLKNVGRNLTLLEVGCGNGWLARRLASVGGTQVTGLDRDGCELRQACRVFADREELAWVAGDIFGSPFGKGSFDIVVIASAIQYFPDVPRLFDALLEILKTGGEIHVLDSPFYATEDLPAARERSRVYYERLGIPEMSAYYHHHSLAVLEAYNPVPLYTPTSSSKDSPFPWICLRPSSSEAVLPELQPRSVGCE